MADRELKNKMNASIQKIVRIQSAKGDNKVYSFSYKGIYTDGYDKHPTITQHQQMKNELLAFVRSLKAFQGFSKKGKSERFMKNSR
jgi:hypothetical protein